MKNAIVICLLSLAWGAGVVHAQVNIAWDRCASMGGPTTKVIACTDPDAVDEIVVSFAPPAAFPAFASLEAWIDMSALGAAIPPWWDFSGCHGAPAVSVVPPGGPGSCQSPLWAGATVLSPVVFPFEGSTSREMLYVGISRPVGSTVALAGGVEYEAFRLRISHPNPGTCAGCTDGIRFNLRALTIRGSYCLVAPLSRMLTIPLANRCIVANGAGCGPVAVGDDPEELFLAGPQPNPASGSDLIVTFSAANRSTATLELFDPSGRRIARRVMSSLSPGNHLVNLAEGTRLSPGVYQIKLVSGDQVLKRKAVVVD